MSDHDLTASLELAFEQTRRHFDATSERLESKIDLLAEGLSQLSATVDRRFREAAEENSTGFIETRA